jgi:hypothetical protein
LLLSFFIFLLGVFGFEVGEEWGKKTQKTGQEKRGSQEKSEEKKKKKRDGHSLASLAF